MLLSMILGLLICVFEMDFLKGEGSIARPPSQDGSNYAHLKVYMKKFIKPLMRRLGYLTYSGSYTSLMLKIEMYLEMFLKILQQPQSDLWGAEYSCQKGGVSNHLAFVEKMWSFFFC